MVSATLRRWREELSRFWRGLLRRSPAERGPIRLDRRRIYILPTRAGLLFTGVLLAMLFGAINYNNSLAYALTFLLASVALVSILHSFRNLHGLTFYVGHAAPVFAGAAVRFPIAIENEQGERFAITLSLDEGDPVVVDIARGETQWVELQLASHRRGWLPLPRITVASHFPIGLVRAWGYLHFASRALIYPAPAQERSQPIALPEGAGSGGDLRRGSDDFAQLRPYQPGDSLHHVNWKAFAREQGLVVKQFGAAKLPQLWLAWESTSGRDVELRLSQLTRWVVDAEMAGIDYGLLMPLQRIVPAHGTAHRRLCLETLALHGLEASRRG